MLEKSAPRKVDQYNPLVNRPNREGDSLLHISTESGASKCTEVLLKYGAVPKRNAEHKIPQIGDQLDNQDVLSKLLTISNMPNYIKVELKEQYVDRGQWQGSVSPQHLQLFELEGDGDFLAKQDCSIWSYDENHAASSHLDPYDIAEVYFCHNLSQIKMFPFRF